MRKLLCRRWAYISIALFFTSAQGQTDHFAYAITAINRAGGDWIAFRKLDTRTGEFSDVLLNVEENNSTQNALSPYKLSTNARTSNQVNNIPSNTNQWPALGNSVAAIAYDFKSNRLYYTPMNTDQLRYIDLSTMKVTISDQYFSKASKYDPKNVGPINRMVIAPDEYGYTITNDGNHLIRFTTDATPVLTDLGDLVDDPQNKDMTVHSPCANSGGDLIADNNGNLYLITGSNRVYKIDIATRLTTYQATISGLPQKFTTSGAAVNDKGKLILGSSLYSDDYFIVDPETWSALPSLSTHEIFGSADLANSNILITTNSDKYNMFLSKSSEKTGRTNIFPNPVQDDHVNVQFMDLPAGVYTIQLATLLGKRLIQRKVNIAESNQTETFIIPRITAQGFYYIRILDENKNVVGIQKLVLERW